MPGASHGRAHHFEVGRVEVGEDDEPVAPMVQPVLDVGPALGHELRHPERIGGRQDEDIGRRVGLVGDDDVALAAGELQPDVEALVGLLVDENVVDLLGPELVAPHLVGAHGVVRHRVEEVALVGRPCRAVVGPFEQVRPIGARRHVADAQRELLVTVEVGGPGQQAVARADLEGTELEEALALGVGVLVQQDDLGGAGGARAPAMDRSRRAPRPSAHVPPRTLPAGHALVGFLGPGLDLAEDGVDQVGVVGQPRVGVGVLGLEVGNGVGILPIPHPRPRILGRAGGPVPDMGDSLGDGGIRHRVRVAMPCLRRRSPLRRSRAGRTGR